MGVIDQLLCVIKEFYFCNVLQNMIVNLIRVIMLMLITWLGKSLGLFIKDGAGVCLLRKYGKGMWRTAKKIRY